jgi:hypothetical protein
MNQAFCNNGIIQLPQYQSVIIQVPTMDFLKNQLELSSIGSHELQTRWEDQQNQSLVSQSSADDSKLQTVKRKDKLQEFADLEKQDLEENVICETGGKGFNLRQLEILEQQIRMHSQLLGQNYVQVYANPVWWVKSESIKKNLQEIREVVRHRRSPQTTAHVDNCLEMCEKWELELKDNNEENKRYAEFLYNEQDFDVSAFEAKTNFKGRFHSRFMEHIVSSKAILYPKLLPRLPFRVVTFKRVEPPNSELTLLALGLERFQHELYEKLNKLNPYKIRQPRTKSIAAGIVREYNSFRSEKCVMKLIESYKNHPRMNPIKFFFLHKRAPKVHHELEKVDCGALVPPKHLQRGKLPRNWDNFMFSHERVSRTVFVFLKFYFPSSLCLLSSKIFQTQKF